MRRVMLALLASAALLPASAQTIARQGGGRTGVRKPAAEAKPAAEVKGETVKEGATEAQGFTLRVTKGPPRLFTLKAKDAKVTDIARELSRRLNVPVQLSPLMAQQVITIDFGGVNLESTLRMLAPHPYVDYVASGGEQQPSVLAVYLHAINEKPPSLHENVNNSSQALLIEGDTEEGTEEYERRRKEMADPLRITFQNNRLSVYAEQQPLSVVLFKVASELGVPFELGIDTGEVVNADFKDYTFEQAMRTLSPSVRFFYRADLLNFELYPIRIALSASPNAPPRAND